MEPFNRTIKHYLNLLLVDKKAATEWTFFGSLNRGNMSLFTKGSGANNRTVFCEM
jgi:hypothetical protein